MRERPLVYLVPPAAAALYGAVCLEMPVDLHTVGSLLAVLLLCTVAVRRHGRLMALFAMLTAACAALTGFAAFRDFRVEPIRARDGQICTVTATVLRDAEAFGQTQRALLAVETEDGARFRTRCYLPGGEPLLAGDRLCAEVTLYVPDTLAGFDRAAYQASEGCYIAAAYTKTEDKEPVSFVRLDSERDSLRFAPQRISRFCRAAVQNALPEREAGLLNGLLLGGSRGLREDDRTAFRIAGLSHLIAVSGLHIGFLVGFCTLLFGRKWGAVVSVPLVLLFVPIAGATPSVLRAALMYLTAAGGFALRRQTGGVNALLTALAVLLLRNPYAIASVGLQLSFAATLGLMLFARRMQGTLERPFFGAPKAVRRVVSIIAGAISCTVCSTIFTAPLLLTSFGAVSLLSPVSNLLAVGVTSICFIGGFVLCLAAAVCPPAVPLCAGVLRPLLSYLLWTADRVADLGFGILHPDNRFGLTALGVFFVLLLAGLTLGKRIRWRYVLPCAAVVIGGLCAAELRQQNGQYAVTYLPCGAGQAVLLHDTGHTLLIDCASGSYQSAAQQVREWMRWNGVRRLDAVVLTAVDQGHAGDLPELLETTEVGTIFMPADCKERKNNAALLELVRANGAQELAEPVLPEAAAPVTVFPVTEGKLGVQIAGQVLILHSPTQKQLAAYMEQNALPQAQTVVLSGHGMTDTALVKQIVTAAGAQHIIIAAWSQRELRSYDWVDVQSPLLTGEITQRFKKE